MSFSLNLIFQSNLVYSICYIPYTSKTFMLAMYTWSGLIPIGLPHLYLSFCVHNNMQE